MANKRKTLYLHGKVYWAKIFGAPRPNYDGDAREWTFEFEPDAESLQELRDLDLGLEERVKDKSHKKGYEDRGAFITLKRGEFKFDGERNEHIRVVDAAGAPWAGALIGNASEVDVKVNVVDYGPRKKAGIYPQAIRVLDLVEFEREEFAPLPEGDARRVKAEAKRKAEHDEFKKDFGLDEDEQDDEPPFEVDEPKQKGQRKLKPDHDDLDDDIDL